MRALTPLAILPLLSLLACSSLPPAEQAHKQGQQRVAQAVGAATEAVDPSSPHPALLRFNPCDCPAPDHELLAHGRWTRVVVDADPHLQDDLSRHLSTLHARPGLHRARVTGYLDGTTSPDDAPDGAPTYPRFVLLDIAPEDR